MRKEFGEQLKHLGKIVGGILLLFIGMAGIALPVLPGFLLIFLGLQILGVRLIVHGSPPYTDQVEGYEGTRDWDEV